MPQSRTPRLLLGVGAAIAALIAALPPAFYFAYRWTALHAELEGSVNVQALAISRIVSRNPETWRYQENLLSELLAFSAHGESGAGDHGRVRVLGLDGELIAEHGGPPPPPIAARRAQILDSGRAVAYVEDSHSLRPLLWGTLLAALAGLLLGAGVYAVFRVLPLRAVERALARAEEEAALARSALAEKVAAEARLAELNRVLEQRVSARTADLERANREVSLLGELTAALQMSLGTLEASAVIGRYLGLLFPSDSGGAYVIKASRNLLERIAHWGTPEPGQTFGLEECWALRRGQPYAIVPGDTTLACAHVACASGDCDYVCIPMSAQGATLGLLHVRFLGKPEERAARRELAPRTAEQLALALANLRLREALREQSIRDALTGLNNRRFLEESLERELARAGRLRKPVAVFMLDLDHFKKFNDRFGHEGGDAALRAIGALLRASCRASDLACRFGGEEFTVALPETDRAGAEAWAVRLLADVRALHVRHGERRLEGITVSIGLAMYPEHGADSETLLQAADVALYEAKRAGRDRLVVFGNV
jgi:diguanylate cyclase (GGDEF)-like protein